MFDSLTDKFSSVFRTLSGRGRITESNVRQAMEEVRTALLEADVQYEVAQKFCDDVVTSAIGTEVLTSLHPGEQMIKIVYDELARLMGPVDSHIMYVQPSPTIIMMCGLQGSGKTTTCGKLATYLKKRGKSAMLAAADLQRPAAVEQLRVLAEQVQNDDSGGGTISFFGKPELCAEYGKAVGVAVKVCQEALAEARRKGCDVLILDTAGRLHINDALMGELRMINQSLNPHQIYLVIDAMTGQDAVNSAKAFNDQLELDGIILSKTDSDTRGGAALTVKAVTSKPIKFIGTGEKLDGLEEFHPERMASRILGMGDVVSLVEKAQQQVTQEEAEEMQEKMAKGKMTLDDFLNQLRSVRKMGSMKGLLGMLPGIGKQLKNLDIDDRQMDQTEAIIQSMTKDERADVESFNHSRRRRVATGSGTRPEEVGQLIKSFSMMSDLAKQMSNVSMFGRLKTLMGMGSMDLAGMRPENLKLTAPRKNNKKKKPRRNRSR